MDFTLTHGSADTTIERKPIRDNTQDQRYGASLEDEVFKSSQVHKSSQTSQVLFNNTAYMSDVSCERNCVCKSSESDGARPRMSLNKPALTVNETEDAAPNPFLAPHTFQVAPQEEEMNRRTLAKSRTQNYGGENNPFEVKCTAPPSAEETDRHVCFEQSEKDFEEEEKIKQGPCIIPAVRPRFSRGAFGYGVKRSRRDLGSDLLELQDSFSQTKAHRIFHESLQDATVDLRDNHHTGRKHVFYGLNSYYYHD